MAQHKGSLGGGVFSIREVEYMESLPAVDRVRSGRIVYNDAFKRDCIRRYRNGESPAEIFRSAGLDSALIGYKRIERSIARWKATLGDDGEPPTVPSPFIVSTDTRWNPSQRRRLNSVSPQPDRRYRYVDDTADTATIDPSDAQRQDVEEIDTRNLIIAQQARRIRQLEIELSELRHAKCNLAENPYGGGVFICRLGDAGLTRTRGNTGIATVYPTLRASRTGVRRSPYPEWYGGCGTVIAGWKERHARGTQQKRRRAARTYVAHARRS